MPDNEQEVDLIMPNLQRPGGQCDIVLQMFAKALNQVGDGSISMTLSFAGTVVSGEVIGRAAWLSAMRVQLNAAGDESGEIGDSLSDLLSMGGDDAPAHQYGYIHLKNVRIGSPGAVLGSVQGAGALWRGQIGDVSGWCLGRFVA